MIKTEIIEDYPYLPYMLEKDTQLAHDIGVENYEEITWLFILDEYRMYVLDPNEEEKTNEALDKLYDSLDQNGADTDIPKLTWFQSFINKIKDKEAAIYLDVKEAALPDDTQFKARVSFSLIII